MHIKKNVFVIIIVVLLLTVTAMGATIYNLYKGKEAMVTSQESIVAKEEVALAAEKVVMPIEEKANSFEYEKTSVVGIMPGVDSDALLAKMQENVDKSAISFSIESRPTVENGSLNISFENPKGNKKDLVLELFDTTTGESIYKSSAVIEGSYLPKISISKKYKKGEHPITAYITGYELATHEEIGQAAAELKLRVD